MKHQFNVIIDYHPTSEDHMLEMADRLGELDCLDASVGGHEDGVEALFDREADSLDAAIKSAVGAIESAGYRVIRVELQRDTISL